MPQEQTWLAATLNLHKGFVFMRNIIVAVAMSAAVLAGVPASAATFTKYTARTAFEAAAGSVAVETFNSYQADVDFSNKSIDFGAFRLVHSRNFGGDKALIDAPPVASGLNGTTQVQAGLAGLGANRYAELVIEFAAPVTAFAANFGSGSAGTVYFEVLGENFSQTVSGDGFFGFRSETAFTRVVLKPRNGSAFNITMDNLTFSVPAGVPEPASWAMMIAGFGLAGSALRASRRQKLVTA